jgi:hypothetical protein
MTHRSRSLGALNPIGKVKALMASLRNTFELPIMRGKVQAGGRKRRAIFL